MIIPEKVVIFSAGVLLGSFLSFCIVDTRQPKVSVIQATYSDAVEYALMVDGRKTAMSCILTKDAETCSDLYHPIPIKQGQIISMYVKRAPRE